MKVVCHILTILSVLMIMWLMLSWADVLRHNDPISGDHQYSRCNLIYMFAEGN